jgi:DNA-binding CsgD family transcriptional regulator
MLYGRREERALIAALLAGARAGRSGVLVLRGEAGIGKGTLLEAAAEHAAGFQVLRGAGVESETGLAYAGLHQLLRPALGRLDELPDPQAGALGGTFGLAEGQASRFLVGLGVLSLVTRLARERPVLCLVTDAQWLDQASVDTLVFVGRRLDTEPIVLLLAAEDTNGHQFHAHGLPSLRLGGLDREAAGQLLAARAGEVARDVGDWLIDQTGGHPLALVELPATLTVEQLTGHAPLPERPALGSRVQRAFLPAVRRLPPATQRLLLVAAAEDTGELATILAAGHALDYGQEALEPAERAGLVEVTGQELRFRHPLVRSAIYQGATFTARQAAHRAMITVLASGLQADRRAWHLAAAAVGPDEQVAAALEASAAHARRRGGPAAAAAALERAAALTPEPSPRGRRLVAAAEQLWQAGHGQRARMLLDQVQPAPADLGLRARMAAVGGAVELATGTPATACDLLLEGAALVLRSDPGQAAELLAAAAQAALAANQPDLITKRIGPALSGLPGHHGVRVQRVAQSLIQAGLGNRPRAATTPDQPREPATTWPSPAWAWVWPMLVLAEPAVDELTAGGVYSRLVATSRAAGTVSALTVALGNLAITEASLDRWQDAMGTATEGLQVARETGQHATASYFMALLAWFAAQQGRSDECRRLADEALAVAASLRLPVVAGYASWHLAQLDLAEGQPRAALDRLQGLSTPGNPTQHAPTALLATSELVDAAVRSDALEGVEPHVARFERWAESDKRTWSLVTAARCRALITRGRDAERHYRAALAVGGLSERPFQLARAELAYGEWLRRARRRADARSHLRDAQELFERLGATPWVERARSELRASGESARRRDPSTFDQLTPQERQVAGLASQGLRNKEIAAELYLSTHTVSYHLHKVFTKLGITSRAELHQLDLDDDSR